MTNVVDTLSSMKVKCIFQVDQDPLFDLTQAIGSNLLDLSITVTSGVEARE